MNWVFQNGIPIYSQLADGIKARIISGEYSAGSRLPSVRELAAEAGVNPNTMQRALSSLEQDGFLHSERTTGRFVTDDMALISASKKELARQKIDEFLSQMSILGFTSADILQLIKEKG